MGFGDRRARPNDIRLDDAGDFLTRHRRTHGERTALDRGGIDAETVEQMAGLVGKAGHDGLFQV